MSDLKRRLLENPSAGYQPGSWLYLSGLSSATLDGKPLFTWLDIPRMVRDPQVRLVERMWRSPFRLVTWKVRAEDRRVARFVDATLRKFWWRSLPLQLKNYFRFGYAPGAAEFRLHRGAVRLDKVRAIDPADAVPHVWKGTTRFAGFMARDTKILCPHAMWFAGQGEYGPFHDNPPLAGMFNPWLEKNSRNGALDHRNLYSRKNAARGDKVRFPNETVNLGPAEAVRKVHASDLARQIAATLETNSTAILSSERYQNSDHYKWDIEAPQATAEGAGRFFLDYVPQLDREMTRGAQIPDEVLEAAHTGSGWSGRTVPLMQFFGGVDESAGMVIEAADAGWLRYAVAANFSPSAWYEIEPDSLVEKILQDGQGDGGGGQDGQEAPTPGEALGVEGDGKGGWQPYTGKRGGRGQKNARTGAVKYLSTGGSPIPREVRRRVRGILKRRDRRRPVELSWTRYDGPRGGHGWKDESGQVVYQAEAPRDADTHDGTPGGVDRVADSKVARIVKAVGRVPARALAKVRTKVNDTYGKLKARYGTGYARAIVAAGVAGLPVPLPGASVMMAAPLLAVAELHRRIRGTPLPPDADPAVVRTGSRWFLGRVFGTARQTLSLSDGRAGPTDDELRQVLGYVMLHTQEQHTAAGNPAGAEPYLRHLGDLADDPARLRAVLGPLELAWEAYTGPKGGRGWKNTETGRVKYGGNRPGEAREKQQASAGRAAELTALVQSRAATPEHFAELVTHLPALTVEQLHDARVRLGTTFKGTKRTRADMVRRLTDHVNTLVEEERANPTPPAPPPPAPSGEPVFARRPDGTPVAPAGDVHFKVPTKSLKLDPERFQYKLGTDKKGVTDQFKDTTVYNPALAGVLSVWRDPETGQDHVINGHHRYELADRLNHPDVNVQYVHAHTPAEARAAGALQNIAEGRGTAIDAAKFFRDSGIGPDEAAAKGVNLRENLARDARTLLHLSDGNFSKLARGQIELPAALAVARHVTDPAKQDRLFQKIKDREDDGKDTSPRHLEEMARMMAAMPTVSTTTQTLWGDETTDEDVFDERAELAAAVRADLAREVNDFAAGASERRAEKLGEHGNVLDVETNKGLKERAERAKNQFDLLAHRKGPISDALNAGAVELKKAKTRRERDDVRARTAAAARVAIDRELGNPNVGQPVPAVAGAEGPGAGGGEPADPNGSPVQGAAGQPAAVTDPFAHATADHTAALSAIPRGGLGWVAGHQVRHLDDGRFQVETQKAYKTGTAAETSQHINDTWRRAAAERSPIEKALHRAAAFTEPDWFGGGALAEEVARRKAKVPAGARAVSLDENTRGRPGTVERDPETGAARLVLDGTSAHHATDFEPLDSSHSWRIPEKERPEVEKPKQGDLFAGEAPAPDLPAARDRARAAKAAWDKATADLQPLADRLNAMKPGKAYDQLAAELDAKQAAVAPLKADLDAAHESLSAANGHHYVVTADGKPVGEPFHTLEAANAFAKAHADRHMRGDYHVLSQTPTVDEYGQPGTAYLAHGSGKRVAVERRPRATTAHRGIESPGV